MLPVTITLAVDEANTASTTDHILARVRQFFTGNTSKSVYHDEDHSSAARDMLTIQFTDAKQNGNFYGTEKSGLKLTMDRTVNGVNGESISVPSLIEVNTSFPVGMDDADKLYMRQFMHALIDRDDVMDLLHSGGQV